METYRYRRPDTVAQAVQMLAEAPGLSRVLAGGTDLLTQLRSGLARPSQVVDIKGIAELHRLEADDNGLFIGAAVFFNRVIEQREVTGPYNALVEAAGELASYQIRNRATVAGNVANASPCADSVPPLCVLGGQVHIAGPDGTRATPVDKFIVGNREVTLSDGEFVTGLFVPRPGPKAFCGFAKRKRVKGHDLALANAALLWDPDAHALRLAVGSCTPKPAVVDLASMLDDGLSVERAVELAQATINPIDDVRAGIDYRRDMVATMVRRLFARLTDRMTSN